MNEARRALDRAVVPRLSALLAGCETLLSEDMRDGMPVGRMRVVDPFAG